MKSKNETQANNSWKINSLRYTLFPKPNFVFDENWWETLIGTPPDNVSSTLKNQIKHYEGSFNSGSFIIDVDPLRIHLIFTPAKNSQEVGTGINLGGYHETLNVFTPLIEKWLAQNNCPIVNRIAFGGLLLIPVSSKTEGYKCLQSYLNSVQIDTENSVDFLYQINRPRISQNSANEILINRLSKWSVINFETTIQGISIKNISNRIISSEYGVSLEFDINTDANFQGEFSPAEQKRIFKELLQLSDEISLKGDIK